MKKIQVISIVVCLLLFACLAAGVQSGRLLDQELLIYHTLMKAASPLLTGFMRGASFLCDPVTLIVLCLFLLVLPKTRKTIAVPVCAAAVVSLGANTVLKRIFLRDRPDILRIIREAGYSFPSSHSIVSAAIGTVLWTMVLFYLPKSKRRNFLAILCVLFPLAVGVSRIYLGVHYAGDVVGGWLLGYVVGFSCSMLWNHWSRA